MINEVWLEDTVFVLNQLEELNASDALLADSMDLSRVGIFGWSLGGATAVYALQRDERLLAGAMLDNPQYPDMNDGLQQPALFMRSEESEQYPFEETFINSVEQGYYVQIAGSTHMIFSDVPISAPGFAFPLDVGEIDPLRGAELVNAYMLAFFDEHLKGNESPLLDAVPPEYEEVTFEVIG